MIKMQIAIASGKGGVGKSSVAASLIYILKENYPLIAVDADADAAEEEEATEE